MEESAHNIVSSIVTLIKLKFIYNCMPYKIIGMPSREERIRDFNRISYGTYIGRGQYVHLPKQDRERYEREYPNGHLK